MSRAIGTVSRGVRAPIIKAGDDIVKIVTDSVLEASKDAGFDFNDRDIVAMTEAIVARAVGDCRRTRLHRLCRLCRPI